MMLSCVVCVCGTGTCFYRFDICDWQLHLQCTSLTIAFREEEEEEEQQQQQQQEDRKEDRTVMLFLF